MRSSSLILDYWLILKSRFRKSFLLLFAVICTTVTVCFGSEEKLTIECAKKYLKDRKIDEDILSYVNPYVGSLTDCESAVKSKLASVYSNLRNRLNGNRLDRPFTECTMRDIEEEDDESYELHVLREAAIDLVSNWRFWSYWSKGDRLDELRSAANRIVEKSLLKCKGHREFGDLFTNIQDGIVQWNRSGEEEYCIRTKLVSLQLLNPLHYNFRENPKYVRTELLECESIFASVADSVYAEIKTSRSIPDCYIEIYRNSRYHEYLLKAEVLSKLSLSKSDRSREKQDFINSMVDITHDTQNACGKH